MTYLGFSPAMTGLIKLYVSQFTGCILAPMHLATSCAQRRAQDGLKCTQKDLAVQGSAPDADTLSRPSEKGERNAPGRADLKSTKVGESRPNLLSE
jgi:hypothetical protein